VADSCERGNEPRGSIWGIAGIAEEMLAPQEGLCSKQLLCYFVRFVPRSNTKFNDV
jgi:hypothetical protein